MDTSTFVLLVGSIAVWGIEESASETIHYPKWVPYIGAMLCITMLVIKAGS